MRERVGVKGPLNLDNTPHKCNWKNYQQDEVTAAVVNRSPIAPPQSQSAGTSYQEEKNQLMKELHDENVTVDRETIAAIRYLADGIVTSFGDLSQSMRLVAKAISLAFPEKET